MSAALLLLALIVAVPQPARADSSTWTSDADWNSGTIDPNLVLEGTGDAAYLRLRRSPIPDWMRMDPGSQGEVPEPRDGYCLAWIDVDDSFLMFGGWGSGEVLNDTWKYWYGNDTWVRLHPATSPKNRSLPGCAYDPGNRVVVLANGADADVGWIYDTWEFDATTDAWREVPPTGPHPRELEYFPLTYDARRGRIVGVAHNRLVGSMETWSYDASAKAWENRNPARSPNNRDLFAIAYDPLSDRTLLFGGATGLTVFCDTWEYAYGNNTWRNAGGCGGGDPEGRVGHAMALRDSCAGVLMFGGYNGIGYFPETWCFLTGMGVWFRAPVLQTPGARRSVTLATSPVDGATVLFGGYNTGGKLGDTWAFANGYVVDTVAPWTSGVVPEDTGCDSPAYDRISWDQAGPPPGAFLRLGIATSSDAGGPWTFRGPTGVPGERYTTSGQAVWPGEDGHRYFRIVAALSTMDPRVTPRLEDASVTWSCPPTPPSIRDTAPYDGQTNVPISAPLWVNFTESMDPSTVRWTISGGVTATGSWSRTERTLRLAPIAPLQYSTGYTVQITAGRDRNDGLDLVPGPVPNPWSFTTSGPLDAPGGLVLSRPTVDDIRLDWRGVAGATAYRVYGSADRLDPFPSAWSLLGTTALPAYVAAGHATDGLPHAYLVHATNGLDEGPNSTMGAKVQRSFPHTPGSTNIAWFSLPYETMYGKASDIADDLGPDLIDVVGKWNSSRQAADVYYFARGGWRGTDFAIAAGDGLFVGTRAAFEWVLYGTDRDATLGFTPNPPPTGNVNWVGLPYAGAYGRASDIADELTPSKVVEIGLWDAATQAAARWTWNGSAWAGTDFPIAPGAGAYVVVVSRFTWAPALVTPARP